MDRNDGPLRQDPDLEFHLYTKNDLRALSPSRVLGLVIINDLRVGPCIRAILRIPVAIVLSIETTNPS